MNLGMSSHSARLPLGKRIVVAPLRFAAMVFSRRPPIRRSLPLSEISPVMATVAPNGWSNARERRAEARAKPADGPIVRTVKI